MSANVIALLYASIEPGEVPPLIPSEQALDHTNEGQSAIQPDFTLAGSPEIDPTQANLSDCEADAGEPGQESPTAEAETALCADAQAPTRDPDLWLYRDRTVALLRRYMRLSIEVGRMPSLLGREFFRARVTSYKASTFEDSVIFVHDVEVSLEKLNGFDQQMIAMVVLQEYSQEEAGRQLGCGLRHAARCYAEALDRVTEIFLEREMLSRFPRTKTEAEKSCQGGKTDGFPVSDSKQSKNKF